MGATISGKVSDAQGKAVAGAKVTAQESKQGFSKTAVTHKDGTYVLDSLPPGVYTVTVRMRGYIDQSRETVVDSNRAPGIHLNLRLRSVRPQTVIRKAEELNPNVFVVKLDTNEIKRKLTKRGAELQLPATFQASENDYGKVYGYPLRKVFFAAPREQVASFHASFYESHEDNALNARSFFTVGKLLPSRRNQYGIVASSPLRRDKLSFNFAASRLRDSGFVNGNIQAPLAGERIPLTTDPALRPLIEQLISGFPNELPNLPNVSLRQLNTNSSRDIHDIAFSSRLDYRVRKLDQIAFEQRFLDYSEQPFEMVAGQNPVTFLRPQNYDVTYLHTASPRRLWHFSFNFERLGARLDVTNRYRELMGPTGVGQLPDVSFGSELTSLGPGASFPRRRVENRFYFSPEMTMVHGRHTFSAGFNLGRFQINDLISDSSRGSINFTRDFGHSAVENFLLGLPSSYEITLGNPYRGFRNWEDAAYVQDAIRLSPEWMVSLGLRYEVITAPTEVNGLTSVGYGTDANNVAPQFGFAWNPGRGKTVVRGGYGMIYDIIFPLLYMRARLNPPALSKVEVFSPDLLNPLSTANLTSSGTERSKVKLNSPDLVSPYSHLYSLQVERELPGNTLLRVGYVGQRSIKLPVRQVANRAQPVPGIPATTATINLRRPDPRYLQVTTTKNGAISYLDALQVAVSQRLWRGLTWNLHYTFSKVISTGDTTFADIDTGLVGQTQDGMVRDLKGVASFDTPHALVISYSYELPWASRWQGIKGALFSGWRISGTTTYRSGTPISVFTGSDSPGYGNVDGVRQSDRPNLLNPAILGKSVDNPDTSQLILQRAYFNTNLTPGGRGNLGYRTFRIDGTHNWDFAAEKDFRLPEARGRAPQLQFRAEFFNFFNTPQFDQPNNHITADTFGQITNTVNKGRVVQLMLRLRF